MASKQIVYYYIFIQQWRILQECKNKHIVNIKQKKITWQLN